MCVGGGGDAVCVREGRGWGAHIRKETCVMDARQKNRSKGSVCATSHTVPNRISTFSSAVHSFWCTLPGCDNNRRRPLLCPDALLRCGRLHRPTGSHGTPFGIQRCVQPQQGFSSGLHEHGHELPQLCGRGVVPRVDMGLVRGTMDLVGWAQERCVVGTGWSCSIGIDKSKEIFLFVCSTYRSPILVVCVPVPSRGLDAPTKGVFTSHSVLFTNLIGPPGLLLHWLTCLVTGKGLSDNEAPVGDRDDE